MSSVCLLVGLLSLWNLRQTRRGAYTNFDVSQRAQRQSFYPVLLGLLGAATAVVWWQVPEGQFRYGLGAAWLLVLLCYGLNFQLKVSLHAALSFFLACAIGHLSVRGGVLALLAAGVVAASRLVLQRHTVPELVVGAIVGLTTGGALVWLLAHPAF